jgi:hypothetical protein
VAEQRRHAEVNGIALLKIDKQFHCENRVTADVEEGRVGRYVGYADDAGEHRLQLGDRDGVVVGCEIRGRSGWRRAWRGSDGERAGGRSVELAVRRTGERRMNAVDARPE